MKAIVVTDQAAGTVGMKLAERPEPRAAINDVVVQVYASGFVGTELAWPSTWTDRLDRDRTPSIPGHELAGVVTALGYGTTGLSVGQRVFGLTDWYRDGTLAEYAAVEARNLAPLPGDNDVALGDVARTHPFPGQRVAIAEREESRRIGRLSVRSRIADRAAGHVPLWPLGGWHVLGKSGRSRTAGTGQLRTHAPQQNSISRSPRRLARTDRAARRGRAPSRS